MAMEFFLNDFIEIMSRKENILVGSLYRPPNTNESEFLTFLVNLLETCKREKK